MVSNKTIAFAKDGTGYVLKRDPFSGTEVVPEYFSFITKGKRSITCLSFE